MVAPVKGRIQQCQGVVISQRAILFRHLEFRLLVEMPGDQPQVGREEFDPGFFCCPVQLGDET